MSSTSVPFGNSASFTVLKSSGLFFLLWGNFKFTETKIKDLYIIEPEVFKDKRGYFFESYNENDFRNYNKDINLNFVQDNESNSKKGVLRGLHYQEKHAQDKLVRVISGKIFDVAVDLRKDSETYLQWVGVILSSTNKKQFYIPKGFAHGFLVLSDHASFVYKCTDIYDPSSEGGIPWNDETVAVDWPKLDCEYKTSEKDGKHPGFKEQSFDWAERWL